MVDPVTATTNSFNFCFNLYNCTDPCRKTLDNLDINIQSLETEGRRLQRERNRINLQIKDRPHMKPSIQVTDFIKDTDKTIQKIDSVLFQGPDKKIRRPLPKKCPGGCFYTNCCCVYAYAKKVEDLLAIVRVKIEEGKETSVAEMFENNDYGEATNSILQEGVDLVGMDKEFNKALNFLKEEGFRSIGILGMGGVGKTALLKRIFNELWAAEDHLGFDIDKVIYVEMSAVMDIPSARLAIAKELRLPSSTGDEVLPRQIKEALAPRKFVLFLDDLGQFEDGLRESDVLAKIGVPTTQISNNNKNIQCYKSRVVLTTRFPEVCSTMGAAADQRIQVECLKGEDPWILFKKVMEKSALLVSDEKICRAQKLAELCGGLPLAIVILGKLMMEKSPQEMDEAILKLSELNPEPGMEQEVFNVLLGKSYTSLPTTLQPCFLYACLFPKAYLVEEEEIIHYWVAEEILGRRDQLSDNLKIGHSKIASLKRAYLILDHSSNDSKTTVKMHEMIQAATLWITKDFFFVPLTETLDELPADRDWAKVERISLVGKSIDKLNRFQFEKLSTVILKKSRVQEFKKKCFDFFDSGSMPCLRVLDLSWCEIDIFPMKITELTTLQYLNISHNRIPKLPSELKKLKKLKFLDLSFLNKLRLIPPQVLITFSKLQSLNLYHSGFGPVDGTEGNLLSGDGQALLKELEHLTHLDNLGLTLKSGVALETLQKSKKLNCVHSLFISKCKNLSTLQVPSLDNAQKLKVLRVHNCSDLEEFDIFGGRDVNNKIFEKLCDIEIEGCWVLKNLSWLKYARLLQLLKIDKCSQMKEVISISESSSAGLEDNKDLFSKLRSISLSYLPELKLFCDTAITLPALEQITVLYCPNMKKLPLKAENTKGTLKLIKMDRNQWDTLTWEDDAPKSAFIGLWKFD